MTKYWVIVASKDHVLKGVKEGFCQACHGKKAPLARMKERDWVVFYSSKKEFGKSETLQTFTAIGQVKDDNVYEFQMSGTFANSFFLILKMISSLGVEISHSFLATKYLLGT